MNQDTLIQSYVRADHGTKYYFVSTAKRDANIPIVPDLTYYETLVWEWDAKTKQRGDRLIDPGVDSNGPLSYGSALEEHAAICLDLVERWSLWRKAQK